jgi:hypothetical protein
MVLNSEQRRVVYLSHQLGGYDGVSIEAAKWISALDTLGFRVTPAAGKLHSSNPGPGRAGLHVPALWLPAGATGRLLAAPPLTQAEIAAVIEAGGGPGGYAVLDNIATLPTAADNIVRLVAALETAGMRMLVRHHDPPWDGVAVRSADARFPIVPRGSRHVAISAHLREQLQVRRGVEALVLFNTLDLPSLLGGDRALSRRAAGIAPGDLVLLHPATPYPRKQVGTAARFADAVARKWDGRVIYWLTGGSTDPLAGGGRYLFKTGRSRSPADLYAAADAVLLTSSWEGWGNPVAEGAALGLPVVTGTWPALEEMRKLGVRDIPVAAPDAVPRLIAELDGRPGHRIGELRSALDNSRLTGDLEKLLSR